ncbi:unnamed protein product [Malus baccata var. baccata]
MEKGLKLKEKQSQGQRQSMQIFQKQQQREPQDQIKLAATAINVRLRSSDMPAHMQNHALRYTRSLIDSPLQPTPNPKTRPNPTHLARALKKEFDLVYGPAWHCVVGTSFGSFVTHSAGGFVYFSVDDSLSVLLFKTEVQLVTEPQPPQEAKPSTLNPC